MLSWTDSRTKHNLMTSTNLDILDYLNNGTLESKYLEWRRRKGIAEIFTFIWPRWNDLIKAPRNRSFIVIFSLPWLQLHTHFMSNLQWLVSSCHYSCIHIWNSWLWKSYLIFNKNMCLFFFINCFASWRM